MSAYKDVVRPEFELPLRDLDHGVIEGIVVYDLDRLARRLCFVVAALLAVDILRPRPEYEPIGARARPADAAQDDPHRTGPDVVNAPAVGIAVGGIIAFILVLPWLGWILSATLLFTAVAVALGNRRFGSCLLGGLALASVIQIVFSGLLGISLPAGFVGGF